MLSRERNAGPKDGLDSRPDDARMVALLRSERVGPPVVTLTPGTRLAREWRGKRYEVEARRLSAGGFVDEIDAAVHDDSGIRQIAWVTELSAIEFSQKHRRA